MAAIQSAWHLYIIYGVLLAVGMSGIYIPLISSLTRWFVAARGLMTGIALSGVGLGTMLMPPFVAWLLASFSWRLTFIIVGGAALLLGIPSAVFLRRRPDVDTEPADYDLVQPAPAGSTRQVSSLNLREALQSRPFWMLCALFAAFLFSQQTILIHLPSHASALGLSGIVGPTALSIIGAATILGRIAGGSLGDRVGHRLATVLDLGFLVLTFLWLLLARQVWMLFLFAALFGLGYGALVALMSPLIAELFGLISHGTILGTATFVATVGGAVGPVVAGHLYDVTRTYSIVLLACAGVVVVSFFLSLKLYRTP
jgi:MFS family permease